MPLPCFSQKFGWQLLHAAGEQIGIFDGLVAGIVLRLHAEDCGLDSQVDVLRHQSDSRGAKFLLQSQGVGQDGIVRPMPREAVRQHGLQQLRLKEQAPARRALAVIDGNGGGQRKPAVDLILRGALHQLIEGKAADLANVARRLRQAFLAGVEFLQHRHRNIDVVLFEPKNGRRIVHQHIGVEHENTALLRAGAAPSIRQAPRAALSPSQRFHRPPAPPRRVP